jgi:hypothetical protein
MGFKTGVSPCLAGVGLARYLILAFYDLHFAQFPSAIGANGEWLQIAAPAFMLQVNNWGRVGAGFGIAAPGQPLKREEKYAIWRFIRRLVKKQAGPAAMLKALHISMNWWPVVTRRLVGA